MSVQKDADVGGSGTMTEPRDRSAPILANKHYAEESAFQPGKTNGALKSSSGAAGCTAGAGELLSAISTRLRRFAYASLPPPFV